MTKVIQVRKQITENIYLQLTSQARVHLPNILKAPKNLKERHQKPNRKIGEGYDHKAHREKKIQIVLKHTQMCSASTLRDTIFHLPYWQKSKNLTTHSADKALE